MVLGLRTSRSGPTLVMHHNPYSNGKDKHKRSGLLTCFVTVCIFFTLIFTLVHTSVDGGVTKRAANSLVSRFRILHEDEVVDQRKKHHRDPRWNQRKKEMAKIKEEMKKKSIPTGNLPRAKDLSPEAKRLTSMEELESVTANDVGVLLVHWSECTACRHFLPIWDKMATDLNKREFHGRRVNMYMVNDHPDSKLWNEVKKTFDITYYPSLVIKKGMNWEVHDGKLGYNEDAVREFIMQPPHVDQIASSFDGPDSSDEEEEEDGYHYADDVYAEGTQAYKHEEHMQEGEHHE